MMGRRENNLMWGKRSTPRIMDARVKPAHDGVRGYDIADPGPWLLR
jgi:hypothetical protein